MPLNKNFIHILTTILIFSTLIIATTATAPTNLAYATIRAPSSGEEITEEDTEEEMPSEETTAEEEKTTAKETAEDPMKILDGLAKYEAPIVALDEVVLKKGEVQSEMMKQAPAKLAEGTTEENKAIVVTRGDYNITRKGAQFVQDPEGMWFNIVLYVDGEPKGAGVGELIPNGFGNAIWCKDNVAVGEFNCYFKTTLEDNGSVKVLWTMLHGVGEGSSH